MGREGSNPHSQRRLIYSQQPRYSFGALDSASHWMKSISTPSPPRRERSIETSERYLCHLGGFRDGRRRQARALAALRKREEAALNLDQMQQDLE